MPLVQSMQPLSPNSFYKLPQLQNISADRFWFRMQNGNISIIISDFMSWDLYFSNSTYMLLSELQNKLQGRVQHAGLFKEDPSPQEYCKISKVFEQKIPENRL